MGQGYWGLGEHWLQEYTVGNWGQSIRGKMLYGNWGCRNSSGGNMGDTGKGHVEARLQQQASRELRVGDGGCGNWGLGENASWEPGCGKREHSKKGNRKMGCGSRDCGRYSHGRKGRGNWGGGNYSHGKMGCGNCVTERHGNWRGRECGCRNWESQLSVFREVWNKEKGLWE